MKVTFEVSGETNDIEWDASEWIDLNSPEELEKQLINIAEEQASWGVRLVGTSITELWDEVQRIKESDCEDC